MNRIFKMSQSIMGLLAFLATAVVLTDFAQAAPIEKTQKVEGSMSVLVAAGDVPLTYVLDGETIEVAPGESAIIPLAATNIFFPLKTVVTVRSSAIAKPYTYKVVRAVTVEALNFATLSQHSTAFSYVPFPNVFHEGSNSIEQFLNPASIAGPVSTDGN